MTAPAPAPAASLDFAAAARWPTRAAAHILGAGLVIAVLIALPVAPTDLDRHQLPKETVVHVATWLAVLLARPLPARGLRPAALWALGVLLVVASVSSVFALNGWLAFRATSLMLTGAAAFVTARHLSALGHGRVLLGWCGLAGVIGTATGLAQAYGATSPLFALTRVPGGTFGNRNFMAHFASLTLPMLVYVVFTARLRTAALAMAASAVLAAAIVLSRSRAAWIGSGAGLLLFAVAMIATRDRRALTRTPRRAMVLAGTIAAGVIAALAIPNHLAWRSSSPYIDTLAGLAAHDEGSGHGRILQYRNTLQLVEKHPWLGVGPGNWAVRYGDVAPVDDPSWVWGDVIPLNPWPSSDWIALISECGVVAGAAALLLLIAFGWRAMSAVRQLDVARAVAGSALLALLATLVVIGMFDVVLLLPASLLLVALSAGALLQLCDGDGAAALDDPSASSRASAVLALALGLVTLRSVLQTGAYVVAGNGRSLQRLTWAARLDPGSYPIRIALAQRLPCPDARMHIVAAVSMAPRWPASVLAARRCGIRINR